MPDTPTIPTTLTATPGTATDPSGTTAGKLAMFGGSRSVPRTARIAKWPVVTEEDERAVSRVLASGRFTLAAHGEEEIPALEREWAAETGTRHCVAVSNGTAALTLALAAAGIEPGDEVIVPALSFVATAAAPMHLLAVPVFVDVDPDTFNMTPAAVEAAITPRTRAVVVVHLHGLPADMDEINAIARKHGLAVVEDAAQAHGARYWDRPAGGLATVGTFSLNVSKNLATCGEGGLVTTDDEGLARKIASLRQFGELAGADTPRTYISHVLGWNNKPNAIQAAFTRSQLRRFPADSLRREQNVRPFLDRVAELPGFLAPHHGTDRTHAWHILRFRVVPSAFGLEDRYAGPLRAAVQRALRAEGVPAAPYQTLPLPAQHMFRVDSGFDAWPWKLAGTRQQAGGPDAFPAVFRVIEDSFAIQKAHLHPDAGPLLAHYADAFEKVWQHRDGLARLATTLPYTPPWEEASAAGAAEWQSAFPA
ncbi:DegT/DnrJ/EryC1/StrS family aminotransferase [Streptomyces lavendulae]|uniref:DegT/DnrJ/EryC1/StrS family aminotransferase n=1 Tax=Streptomyces lavendulae TaxID=1914 RepID=UPI0033F762E3